MNNEYMKYNFQTITFLSCLGLKSVVTGNLLLHKFPREQWIKKN